MVYDAIGAGLLPFNEHKVFADCEQAQVGAYGVRRCGVCCGKVAQGACLIPDFIGGVNKEHIASGPVS